MTREEWKIHWRQVRLDRPKVEVTMEMFSAAFREIYDYLYTGKQRAFIHLVERYKNKLGQEYFDRILGWEPEAKRRAQEQMKILAYVKNPFFSLVQKEPAGFSGKYIPVPLEYGEETSQDDDKGE